MSLPRSLLALPLAALLVIGAGCKPRRSLVEEGIRHQVLQRGGGVEPTTIDPQRNTGAPEASIIECLFDSLVLARAPNLNEVSPKGAERWEVSADGLTYDFFLRRDARWSNGDPVVAEDYRAAFVRLLEPALAGTLADFAYPILGAEDYHRGRTKDPATVGLTVAGPHHLRIRLRRPMPHFLFMLEGYPFVAVHRPSIEAHGGWLNPASPWTKPGAMVGNGPFRLKSWTPGQVMVLERNPYYWNAAHVTLREIHFHPIDSIDAEERTFRAGQLHLTYSFPTSRLPTYRANHSPALHVAPRLGMHFLNLNTERPPLNDPRVRRALAYAIDRAQLAAKVLDQMPVIPLAYYCTVRLIDPSVQGWSDNIRDRQWPENFSLAAGAAP